MAFIGLETIRKQLRHNSLWDMYTLIAVCVHFNLFINVTINSHTNPTMGGGGGRWYFNAPLITFSKQWLTKRKVVSTSPLEKCSTAPEMLIKHITNPNTEGLSVILGLDWQGAKLLPLFMVAVFWLTGIVHLLKSIKLKWKNKQHNMHSRHGLN